MKRKLFYNCILGILIWLCQFSCTDNIPDCPTKMCILANNWQLVDAYIDGQKSTEELSKYKIILTMPNSKAAQGDFTRTFLSGNATGGDAGTWKTQNNDKELLLVPSGTPEEPYIISIFTPRQLVLIVNRSSNKSGPSQIKYIFEPF